MQLQQLQLQHCPHILSASSCRRTDTATLGFVSRADTTDSTQHSSGGVSIDGGEEQTEQQQAGWALPAHLQQRLQHRQQSMQQLLSAVQWPQLQQQQATTHGLSSAGDASHTSSSSSSSGNKADVQPTSSSGTTVSNSQTHATGCCGSGNTAGTTIATANPSGSSSACCGCHAGLVTLHSSDNLFAGGTGCHMWDAGFLLAEFVFNHPQLFAGALFCVQGNQGEKGVGRQRCVGCVSLLGVSHVHVLSLQSFAL